MTPTLEINAPPVPARSVDPDGRPTVCQVLHGLPVGGAEVLAYRLAVELRDEFRFVFACLDQIGELGERLRDEGFAVHLLGRRGGVDVRCAWRLARFLGRERVDVIHAHQYTPFFYALAGRQFGRRRPVLFTEHGRWFPDYPRKKRILFNRMFLRRQDRVIGVGESVRQALIQNEGIAADRVRVIYNGVDLERFSRSLERDNADGSLRRTVRRELGLAEDAFVVIQVARLDALKDHPTAVRTMHELAARAPGACLVIVGEGPERPKIEAEIERLGVGPTVRLLGLRHDVPRLLAAADAFLLTSISEGIPLTVIEAMAARLPVVSTSVGGLAEVVIESETGFLGPAGDHSALAAALETLSRNRPLAAGLGERGFRRAHELFSETGNHAEYRKLYHEMAVRR